MQPVGRRGFRRQAKRQFTASMRQRIDLADLYADHVQHRHPRLTGRIAGIWPNVNDRVLVMRVSRRIGAAAGRRLFPLALGLALAGAVAQQAWSQTSLTPGAPAGGSDIAGRRKDATPAAPTVAPPDAIPGAKAREPVVPANRAAGDLQPNDALFDAINRGDIAAARDALNRGAELGAVNILGMTPMELSVDLGRNDISFLLLSMRGEDSGRGSRAVAQGQTQAQPAGKSVGSAKPPLAAKPVRSPPVAAKPAPTAKLFANDGGTPQPSAGFLGFGGSAAN